MQIWELEVGFKLNEASLKSAKASIKSELEGAGDEGGKALVGAVNKQTSQLGKLVGTFSSLKNIIAGSFAVGAVSGMIKGVFNLTSQVEKAKISFTTLTKSQEVATQLLKEIDIFASKTPFNKLGLIELNQQLLGFGFGAKQTLPILNAVGNAVSAVGGGQDKLQGVVLALGQMQTKGRVATQELLQIAERGLPVFDILQKKLGLTNEQLGDIGNQGINSSVAIQAILEGFNERFGGSLEKQAQTLEGKRSNIIDKFQQRVRAFGTTIYPIFSTVLDIIGRLIDPLGALLQLIGNLLVGAFQIFGKVVTTVFSGIQIALTFLANNWVAVVKLITATFLTALVIMKRQTITDFVIGTINAMLKGLASVWASTVTFTKSVINLITNFKSLAIQAYQVTVNLIKQGVQRVVTTVRTYAQIVANNIASLSFKALGGSIIQTLLRLVLLGAQFFLIAGIVVAVVVAIYANWDKLKKKLKPLFEFIASVGAKAPEIIANAWNSLVQVITTAIQALLRKTAVALSAIEGLVGKDLGSDAIIKAIGTVGEFAGGLKTTASGVAGAFASIKDGAVGAFEAVTTAFTGGSAGAGELGAGVLDLAGKFEDMGDSAKKWGKDSKEAVDEQKKALDKADDQLKEFTKNMDKLDDTTKKYAEKHAQFYEDIKNSIREVNTELQKNVESYNEVIAKIKEEADAKKKDNLTDFVTKQAQEQIQLESDLASINEEIKNSKAGDSSQLATQLGLLQQIADLQSQARSFTKDTSKETADANITQQAILKQKIDQLQNDEKLTSEQQTALELAQKKYEVEQQILEIKKNIAELEKGTGVDVSKIQQAERQRLAIGEQGKALIDYKNQQTDVDKEVAKKTEEENKKFELEKARLERLRNIYQVFDEARNGDTEAYNALVDQKNLERSTVEEQQLILKLQNERIEINNLFNEKLDLEKKLAEEKIKLGDTVTNLMLLQGKKIRDDVQSTINKINEAIVRMQSLNAGGGSWGGIAGARRFGGEVGAGKTYVVGEEGQELFTPDTDGQIIPNIKTMLREVIGGNAPVNSSAIQEIINNTTDKSMKIENVNVRNGADWDEYVRRQKRLRK